MVGKHSLRGEGRHVNWRWKGGSLDMPLFLSTTKSQKKKNKNIFKISIGLKDLFKISISNFNPHPFLTLF